VKGYKYSFNFTRRGTMCEDSSSFDFLVFATLLLLVLGFVNPKFPFILMILHFFLVQYLSSKQTRKMWRCTQNVWILCMFSHFVCLQKINGSNFFFHFLQLLDGLVAKYEVALTRFFKYQKIVKLL